MATGENCCAGCDARVVLQLSKYILGTLCNAVLELIIILSSWMTFSMASVLVVLWDFSCSNF